MGRVVHIDYETRSEVDLIKCGAYVYAQHSSTEIICLAYAFDDAGPELWRPGLPFPEALFAHFAADEPRSIHAHNAQFERLITKHVLMRYFSSQPGLSGLSGLSGPKPPYIGTFSSQPGLSGLSGPKPPYIGTFYCTAAQARARSLPGGLDDLGRCLNLPAKKDRRGKELIKLLCIPTCDADGGTSFSLDPALLSEMYEYCRQDVWVERLAAQMTPPLTDAEHDDWVVSELINDAGLRVDIDFAAAATKYAEAEMAEIKAELSALTGGKITSPRQYERIKDFVAPLMAADDRVRKAMTVVRTDRRTGDESRKITLDRDARTKLLLLEDSDPGTLPETVLELIELTDDAGRSSVAKYENMVRRAGPDNRVCGAYIFSGAGQTGRFSSVGLQVHNMPRRCAENPEALSAQVLRGDPLKNVMDDLASMLRPSIVAAPGHQLVWGDWSAIEARVLPWLADDADANKMLDVFRTNDADPSLPDIYKVEFANAYGGAAAAVTKDERAVGKVIVLSLGYAGGRRALQSMARAYRVVIDDAEAERLKSSWRSSNPWAPAFWRALEGAAKSAMRSPGEIFTAGRLTYCKPTADSPLYCQLPSGRVLSYPDPRLELVEGKYGEDWELSAIKAQWRPRQGETEWGRISLYGGLLAENATQATAADILRHALGLAIDDGWPVVAHTHDEIVLEVRDDEVVEARSALAGVMLDAPGWAVGLPSAVEMANGARYRK